MLINFGPLGLESCNRMKQKILSLVAIVAFMADRLLKDGKGRGRLLIEDIWG